MPDTKISALSAASALTGAESLPAVQAGATVRTTPAQLMTYLLGQPALTEQVQDIVGGFAAAGPGITLSYNDAANTLTIANANPKATVSTSDPTSGADSAAGYAAGSVWTNSANGVRWFCLDASAGAATWVPQGAMAGTGYVSGHVYTPGRTNLTSSAPIGADTLVAHAMPIRQRVTISALLMSIATGATGSVRMGIYANAGGAPGAKLAEIATPASTGTAAVVQASLASATTLAPGLYWFASLFSGAPQPVSLSATDQTIIEMLGAPVAAASNAFVIGQSTTGVNGTATYAGGLPASFGASSRRNLFTPLIGMLVA